MNRSAVEKFAAKASRELQRLVSLKLTTLGITVDNILPAKVIGDFLILDEHPFPKSISSMRKSLIDEVERHGYEELVKSVAYTWFNRFCALRFMEVNNYIPFRVFTSTSGNPLPNILSHAVEAAKELEIPQDKLEEIMNLKLHGGKDNELYRLLIIAQCNHLAKALPFLFKNQDDYSELLLPDNLLQTDSIIKDLTNSISETDWSEIEIIGWLYQYYISEKKDEVIGKTVKKEDIPAATQLFTPNWIVRYMVDNSLGRLWMLNNPGSSVKSDMEFYIQPESIEQELLKINNPEEIRLIDPACGSGHILVYAFELLYKIYEEHGYIGHDISALILKNNLYGIDIDKRAAQLAAFALMMKARSKDRRFFSRNVYPNIIEIKESNNFNAEGLNDLVKSSNITDIEKNKILNCAELLKKIFADAKNYGSLLKIPDSLSEQLTNVKELVESLFYKSETVLVLKELIKQAEFLSTKYEVCVANPPYLNKMNSQLKDFVKDEYTDYKSDLFAAFIIKCKEITAKNGTLGFMSPFVWMFISSYEKLRLNLISESIITSLIQLEYSGFDGATVPICTFTLQNSIEPNYKGSYVRLSDFKGAVNQAPKTLEAIKNHDCGWFFTASASDFKKIPASPIAYWVSVRVRNIFMESKKLVEISKPLQGATTSDNNRFLRLWFEVERNNIGFNYNSLVDAKNSYLKWFPYNKGGDFRRWYGNQDFIVNYQNDGEKIKEFHEELNKKSPGGRLKNQNRYFKFCASWSKISSGSFAVRYFPQGFIFDVAGSSVFFKNYDETLLYTGLLNTTFVKYILKALSPTLNYEAEHLCKIPIYDSNNFETKNIIIKIQQIIDQSKIDWNNFETSWDFTKVPLLSEKLKENSEKLEEVWEKYWNYYQNMTSAMKNLEEENNRIFIEAYGLQDELEPDVPLKEITLTGNPVYRYGAGKTEEEYKKLMLADTMKEFLSYAVGCMMGRYSIDKLGLILANQGDTIVDYISKVTSDQCPVTSKETNSHQSLATNHLSFTPDDDGIVPVIDQPYFEDDCAERFVEFLSVTFGREKLEENLHFLVDGLGLKGSDSPVEKLRKYFATQFFKDHMQRYKKRPIYWLMSSGKERAFQCLIYMHRYTPSTLARVRTSYVHELQGILADKDKDFPELIESASTTGDKNILKKEQASIKKKINELAKFDEELRHLADQRISIDLDDGVKHNYGLFGNLLTESKAITGNE